MSKTNNLFDIRSEQWLAFCEKYEKRGKLNTADLSFSEVSYKHFAKPKLLKTKIKNRKQRIKNCQNTVDNNFNETEGETDCTIINVDISDIIDEDTYDVTPDSLNKSEKSNIRVLSITTNENNKEPSKEHTRHKERTRHSPTKLTKYNENIHYSLDKENGVIANQNCLKDLIRIVEVDLRSNLKELMICRSECKILESDDYSYWHKCTKKEMKRLQKYISKTELKEYMRYCNQEDANLMCDRISNKIKMHLRELLIKREYVRNDKEKYLKYCKKITIEWQKLTAEVPVGCVILYASCIINSLTIH